MQSDRDAYARFFRAMLDRDILLPHSQFEAWFVSLAHEASHVDLAIEAARDAFAP
jgi:glutamate-1-semialdehyde 2,1-aminomutase